MSETILCPLCGADTNEEGFCSACELDVKLVMQRAKYEKALRRILEEIENATKATEKKVELKEKKTEKKEKNPFDWGF